MFVRRHMFVILAIVRSVLDNAVLCLEDHVASDWSSVMARLSEQDGISGRAW